LDDEPDALCIPAPPSPSFFGQSDWDPEIANVSERKFVYGKNKNRFRNVQADFVTDSVETKSQ